VQVTPCCRQGRRVNRLVRIRWCQICQFQCPLVGSHRMRPIVLQSRYPSRHGPRPACAESHAVTLRVTKSDIQGGMPISRDVRCPRNVAAQRTSGRWGGLSATAEKYSKRSCRIAYEHRLCIRPALAMAVQRGRTGTNSSNAGAASAAPGRHSIRPKRRHRFQVWLEAITVLRSIVDLWPHRNSRERQAPGTDPLSGTSGRRKRVVRGFADNRRPEKAASNSSA